MAVPWNLLQKSCCDIFTKFTGKDVCRSLFANKVSGWGFDTGVEVCNRCWDLQACNFIKKRLKYMCFPVKFVKLFGKHFYRTPLVAASMIIVLGISWNTHFIRFFLFISFPKSWWCRVQPWKGRDLMQKMSRELKERSLSSTLKFTKN